jgi:hypothetical protein
LKDVDPAHTVVQIPVALVEREKFGGFLTTLDARQFTYFLHWNLSTFRDGLRRLKFEE